VAVPEPGAGQVLVAVETAAVNFADALIIRGTYQSSPPLPAVAGMELAGRVVATGGGVHLSIGTRIAGLGYRASGAFADYALVDVADAFEPPATYSPEEAAAFTVAYQTAWFAVHIRGRVERGEIVLVHAAAGGVGLAAVQLAAAAGARVVGLVGSPAKADVARRAGCHEVFVRGEADLVDRIKAAADGGIDVVVDPVGGSAHTVSERVVRFEGRIVVLGFASGQLPVVRPDLLMVKNYALLGLHWGLYRGKQPGVVAQQYGQLVEAVTAAGIRPVVAEAFPFADVPAALSRVNGGGSIGRVVVRGAVGGR
jgi:NADPH2:quinone reductase